MFDNPRHERQQDPRVYLEMYHDAQAQAARTIGHYHLAGSMILAVGAYTIGILDASILTEAIPWAIACFIWITLSRLADRKLDLMRMRNRFAGRHIAKQLKRETEEELKKIV